MAAKILNYVSNTFSEPDQIGGVETCTLAAVKHLSRDRFCPVVLAHGGGPFLEEVKKAGIEAMCLPIPNGLKRLSRNNPAGFVKGLLGTASFSRLVTRVARLIREERVHLVHCHHPYAYLIGGIAARYTGVPCVWHFHDVWEAGLTKKFFMFSSKLLADQRIANSQATALRLPSGPGHPPLRIIQNGFDYDEIRRTQAREPRETRREFGIAPDAVLLGYVSHLAPSKGQAVFLQALSRVVRTFPSVRALIVGGPRKSFEDYPRELWELSDRLGLSDHVTFTGTRWDIPDIMAALDVFVCVAVEEFNCVMIESMCMGKPAILSNVRGGSAVVRDGVTGLLVPTDDPDALARALERLIADERLRLQLGSAGRRHVEETFPVEKVVMELEQLYCQLLGPEPALA
jgi:glycosyltransferase involved in cell wall biosynthesis